ncbi:MAG: hypothetical protein PHO30_08225 [Candidatus Omnitrophica bacterium]|nr:hypothetical protein [Candidatus Omnitrophota bacterium]
MMNRNSRVWFVIALCLMAALISSEAYAWGGGRHSHYYKGDKLYSHRWFWFDAAVAALVIGALVENLPPRHTTVVYSGTPYYYAEGYYYRPYPDGGYIVVAPPPVTVVTPSPAVISYPPVEPQSQSAPDSGTVTVNIPDTKGGYTPVKLKKTANGYIGPQGEYYEQNPTVEQLKVLYGDD